MFTTEDIRHVTLIIFGDDLESVATSLGEAAIMHNRKVTGEDELPAPGISLYEQVASVSGMLDSASALILQHGPAEDVPGSELDAAEIMYRDMDRDRAALERMIRQWRRYLFLSGAMESEINRLKGMKSEMDEEDIPPSLGSSTILSVKRGKVRGGQWGGTGEGYTVIQNENRITVISLPGAWDRIRDSLNGAGFVEDDEAAWKAPVRTTGSLERRLGELKDVMERRRKTWMADIRRLRDVYPCLEALEREKDKWSRLRNMIIIRGWIIKRRERELRDLLRESARSGFYLRVAGRWESIRKNPPVLFRNNPFFRPFELLVRAMGIPRNGEIDPSPVAGVIYMILFGMMFGDLGQGFLLCLAGLVLMTVAGAGERNKHDFGVLLVYCGVSAMVWGALYGGVFSNEHLLAPLLFHPAENMTGLFALALGTGALCITGALFINVINHILSGKPGDALFEPDGIISLLLYTGGLAAGWSVWTGNDYTGLATVLAGGGLLLLCFRGPLRALLIRDGRAFPRGFVEYGVESAAHLVEMLSSFAGNTVSFIRTGAFALSHAGLGLAVYSLAGISSHVVLAGIVIVTGNVFIVLLEGLVCAIQSLRLEYYEIFSRFYRGDGVEFTPFTFPRHVYTRGGKR